MNPLDCPYRYDPDADAWICPQCDDAKIARYHDDGNRLPPPRRNCPKAPGWDEALRNQVLARLADMRLLGLTILTDPDIESRLATCLGGCTHFAGRTCTRWGRACQAQDKWLDKLAATEGCEHWGHLPTGR